jgi:hypothetical protein
VLDAILDQTGDHQRTQTASNSWPLCQMDRRRKQKEEFMKLAAKTAPVTGGGSGIG